MKKTFKRFLSAFLVLAVVLGSAPLNGFVGLRLPDWFDLSINANASAISGKCGDNIEWTLDEETGELSINGTGDMYTYHASNSVPNTPWAENRLLIKNVTISEGITSIGSSAFYGCTNLKSVLIPDGLKHIKDYVFYKCISLESILFPDSVTSIGPFAFSQCKKLESVTLPPNIYSLKNSVFSHCSNLKYVKIPDKVETIYENVFLNCVNLKEVIIPDQVTSLGKASFFGCKNLEKVTFGSSLEKIDKRAFYECSKLKSLELPDKLIKILDDAFAYCSDLTEIKFPESLKTIGYEAFKSCSSLKKLNFPKNLETISGNAFGFCSSLETVSIQANTTTVATPFDYCDSLLSITIDENNINYCSDEYGAMYNKDKTKLLNYPVGNKRTTFEIPDGVKTIRKETFINSVNLKSITIPTSVDTIHYYSFEGCSNITDVYYKGTIKDWNEEPYIINGTNIGIDLNKVTVHYLRDLTDDYPDTLTEGVYAYTVKDDVAIIIRCDPSVCGEITVPSTLGGYPVEIIAGYSFWNCDGITSITIPKSVVSIEEYAFYDCSNIIKMTLPFVGASRTATSNYTGCLGYIFCGSDEYSYRKVSSELKEVEITDMTQIPTYAFYYMTRLTTIKLNEGIKTIGYRAFAYCKGLKEIVIPDSVTSIGRCAFECCSSLTGDFKIPDSVTSIEDHAFYLCTGLTGEFVIPDNVTVIKEKTFYGCKGITSIVIPDGVKVIGDSAFDGCSGLTNVTVPDSVNSIGSGAFLDCDGLTKMSLPFVGGGRNSSLAYSGMFGYLFYSDYSDVMRVPASLKEVIITSATRVGPKAFYDLKNITSIELNEGIKSIGSKAFWGCSELSGEFVVPDSVTNIDEFAFAHCNNLTEITINNADCTIYDGSSTLPKVVTINALCNSTAVAYAEKYGNKINVFKDSHNEGEWEISVAPTPETDGLEVKKCIYCGFVVEERIVSYGCSFTASPNSQAVIDINTKMIYGLDEGISNLNGYIDYQGCELKYNTSDSGFGTGTTVDVVVNDIIVDTYTILIFGDVTGDGVVDAFDRSVISSLSNFESEQFSSDSAYLLAGDLNGDSIVDIYDLAMMTAAVNFDYTIPQTR